MQTQNFINAQNVHLLNVLQLLIQKKKIKLNVKFVTAHYFYLDMFHLLIAQVMTFWWLLCLLEQQLWIQLYF